MVVSWANAFRVVPRAGDDGFCEFCPQGGGGCGVCGRPAFVPLTPVRCEGCGRRLVAQDGDSSQCGRCSAAEAEG